MSLLLAIADITLAGADLGFQAFREEILKYEGGQEFLNAWDKVYAVGGILVATPAIISLAFSTGARLLRLGSAIKNSKALDYAKTFLTDIVLERKIANFTEDSIKLLATGEEAFFDSQYLLRMNPIQKLIDKDVLIFSGKSAESKGYLKEYGFIYKGEKIAAGSASEINKKLAGALKAGAKDEEITSFLDGLERLSKIESGEA